MYVNLFQHIIFLILLYEKYDYSIWGSLSEITPHFFLEQIKFGVCYIAGSSGANSEWNKYCPYIFSGIFYELNDVVSSKYWVQLNLANQWFGDSRRNSSWEHLRINE